MASRRHVALGNVAELVRGVSYRPTDLLAGDSESLPLLRATNIRDRALELADVLYVPPALVRHHQVLRRFDVVIAMSSGSRAAVGRLAQLRQDWTGCVGAFCGVIRPDPQRVHPEYLGYVLQSPEFRTRIETHAVGTAIMNLSRERILGFSLQLPDVPEQRAIAHVLGTLDDKIELNRRMSETLEAMVRALFKSWFVDFDPVRAKAEGRDPGLPQPLADLFPTRLVDSELGEIPEGWEVGPLGEFFDISLGGAWGEDEQSARATVAVRCLRGIDCHDLAEGRIPDVPVRWVSPKQATDRRLPEGAILIEGSGSFCGRSMIWRRSYGELLGEPIGYSNFCKRLDPRRAVAQAAICWMQLRQAYRDGFLQSFRTGTAFPNFDVNGALSNLIVVVPPVALADAFDRVFALARRLNLMAESRTLAALRDALLPKLISGELPIEDTERLLGRVET